MHSYRILIILLAVIATIVVTVLVLTITRGEQRPTVPTSAPSSTQANRLSPAPAGQFSADLFGNRLEIPADEAGDAVVQDPGARPDPAHPDYLVSPPAQMRWQRGWGGAALPTSVSDGPATIRDGIASGFARTPQGAALAAADALARVLAAPEGTWQRVVVERYHGAEQALVDRFARSRARTPDAARYVVVPDGVRVVPGYSPDFAVVEFAARDRLGYRIARWPMTWLDGDWRVAVPVDIETLWGPGTYTDSLSGFGTWRTVA
ncbi:hypothetical protein [Nocardia higoensis]|uniref:hypothetical protein n=1 Tax=Nocardia higoensis TaxID=228599 RepID=UPI00030B1338|nr:hypothetical protein [Nocardia higoensis]